MSIYSEFADCENATIKIISLGEAMLDPVTYQPVYSNPVTIYNNVGIFYELGASEQVARQQIQKAATGQIILNPSLVATAIDENMQIFVTTADKTDKEYRMVTEKNPLNKNEAIIIDIVEA